MLRTKIYVSEESGMQIQEIKNYCMSKLGAYEDYPFGDVPICYRVNKKIFAQIYPYEHDYIAT